MIKILITNICIYNWFNKVNTVLPNINLLIDINKNKVILL